MAQLPFIFSSILTRSSFSIFLFVIFLFLQLLSHGAGARLNFTQYTCNEDSTPAAGNSTSSSNLNLLLSTLFFNSSTSSNGFFNFSVGRGSSSVLYGIALCRGDIGADDCRECLKIAGIQIQEYCRGLLEAIIWEEWCMLRYSNKYVFSTLQYEPQSIMHNVNNISRTDLSRWEQLLGDTVSDIISKASGSSSGKKYATEEARFTDLDTLYSMAQCTPDLSAAQCSKSLQAAKAYLPSERIGGIVLTPSCTLRYELYPFYDNSEAQGPVPGFPSPFPSPPSGAENARLNFTKYACNEDSTPAAGNSTSSSNLNLLLSTLFFNSSTSSNGFFNFSVGRGSSSVLYGIALCRGDIGADDCRECLKIAGIQIQECCRGLLEAIIWEEWCMLRYSNKYIFSTLQYEPQSIMHNVNNISSTDLSRWEQLLGDTVSDIISNASGSSSGKKYATEEARFTDSYTLYSMVQCTPDLSAAQCSKCLQAAKAYLPTERIGGIVLTPSCTLRYELYPFYDNSEAQGPVPGFPSPTLSLGKSGAEKNAGGQLVSMT